MQSTTTNMITCEQCGKLHPAGTLVCDVCGAALTTWPYLAGTPLAEELGLHRMPANADLLEGLRALSGSLCPHCGSPNRAGASFCVQCGRTLGASDNGARLPPGPGPGMLARSPGLGSLAPWTVLRERYRIVRKIAQGGMGAVYEAEDLEAPGTRWAIKEMAQSALHPDERTQSLRDFMREATLLATLTHPNLPTFNGIFNENNKHYLVMEFIPGRTLEYIVSTTRGFLPEDRVLGWAAQLCDVLTYLHTQDPPIIYRDCKPGNIMLVEGSQQVKLIDFGIARFHRAGRSTDDAAYGTAGYSPPEQYGHGQTDQRSDIYALAATLHHLLTGHDPGQNPFHWRSARSYNPHVSRRVDQALMQAVELKPELRFASVEDFRRALGLATPVGNRPTETLPAAAPVVLAPTTALPKTDAIPVAKPRPAPPPPARPPVALPAFPAMPAPALSVSESVIDRGAMGKKARGGRRVQVVNTGEGPLKGRVQASAPWIALNVREFSGDVADLTIKARPRGLALDRYRWRVPNVFGVLAGGLWQALRRNWLLRVLLPLMLLIGGGVLLTERPLLGLAMAAGLLLGMGSGITQLWLWWVARHVAWFVPAPRQNVGYVQVESNAGARRVEVRVLARPGFLRLALGWLLVSLLLITELVVLGWAVLYWPW
jgi:serine/threonine-protein kinase